MWHNFNLFRVHSKYFCSQFSSLRGFFSPRISLHVLCRDLDPILKCVFREMSSATSQELRWFPFHAARPSFSPCVLQSYGSFLRHFYCSYNNSLEEEEKEDLFEFTYWRFQSIRSAIRPCTCLANDNFFGGIVRIASSHPFSGGFPSPCFSTPTVWC